ncbi:hypothetical protein [Brevundimonas sp.]|uniref:hypothetical protein n=1 Tax=Brevundimonas sp. TaxID=1871086 RepID=UPI002FD90BA4
MLVDAIRAETWRLARNRATVFWTVGFLPIVGLAMGILGNLFLKANADKITVNGKAPPELNQMLMGGPIRVVEEVIANVGAMANPIVLLFMLIGAATLYSGDYRWETWRLISARNSRTNLLLGKVATMGLLALLAMVVLLSGEIAQTVSKAVILERPMSWAVDGNAAGRFAGLFGLSWLAVMQFTMVGLLVAVLTRSLLAALFAPIVIAAAQVFSPQALAPMGIGPDDWIAVLLNPGTAFGYLKATLIGGQAALGLPDQALLKGVVSVALNLFLPLLAALAWFKRQDLSKE